VFLLEDVGGRGSFAGSESGKELEIWELFVAEECDATTGMGKLDERVILAEMKKIGCSHRRKEEYRYSPPKVALCLATADSRLATSPIPGDRCIGRSVAHRISSTSSRVRVVGRFPSCA
jgi:hypothetical protein